MINVKNNKQFTFESWKPITGFDGYEISNYGMVRNKKGTFLNGYKNSKGYIIVCLNKKNKMLRNLVVKEFLPNEDNKKYINHKDGDLSNSSVFNLEWTNECYKYKKSELDRKLAVDDYFKGMSCQEISIKYSVNRKTIGNWIRGFNKKARKNSGWRDFDKINSLVKEYVNGSRTKELAKKYNVCTRTVSSWVKEKGVKPILYSEKMGYTNELKQNIINLYNKNNLTCNDISVLLKLKRFFVYSVVKSYFRENGDYSGIKIMGGRGKYYGSKGSIETRFGLIRYDSLYERDRIIQNSRDFNIKSMERCKIKIKYFNLLLEPHIYKPDFLIQKIDNSIIIEEVKPTSMLNKYDNSFKHEFAIKYCNENGYKFRVVTEKEIYES